MAAASDPTGSDLKTASEPEPNAAPKAVETLDSAELLRAARRGSPQALERLYQQFSPRLLAIIRLKLGPALRAQLESRDVLQSCLLKSLQAIESLEGRSSASFMAWLAAIADHEIKDRAAHLGRQRRDANATVPLDEVEAGLAAQVRTATSRIALGEELERLEQALETLDEPHRDIVRMRGLEELSFREIGERLGKSDDACRMLFARAMTALTLQIGARR